MTTVALVVNERELILDAGEDDGVQIGMRFAVLAEKEVELASGKVATIKVPKVIVKVTRFEGANLAVGRTFRTIRGRPGAFGLSSMGTFDALSDFAGTPDRKEIIRSRQKVRLSSEERLVTPGDEALQTLGDEYADED
ncbi:hypothetical protein [Williamsia sp. D3]|uniref:hypothetical protein n=1 Tax=Williamsia sp. D3 TaxID=1313067 RepID=UPI0013768F7A|nr:hypothetical protein [Williamsia sp. D3]